MATLGTALPLIAVLGAYWYLPFAAICNPQPVDSGYRTLHAILLVVVGTFLMIGADVQKHTQLKLQKGLVSDGFFARTRNPNYLGEIMIYFGFAVMANSYIGYAIVCSIWATLFTAGILAKENSFMKKDGWHEYSQKSLVLLPRIWADRYWENYAVYVGLGVVLFILYYHS